MGSLTLNHPSTGQLVPGLVAAAKQFLASHRRGL